MNYKWKLSSVYPMDGECKNLIGMADIRITISPMVKANSKDVEDFLDKKFKDEPYAKDNPHFSIYCYDSNKSYNDESFNTVIINGIFPKWNKEEIIKEVLSEIKNAKSDSVSQEKRRKFNEIQNQKGSGKI